MTNPELQAIELAKSNIRHLCDGPLTPFVMISRACDMASRGTDFMVVANALHECLDEFGVLTVDSDEELASCGS